MRIGEVALSMFSANGIVSSARVGFYITLVACTIIIIFDTWINKKINETAFIALLTAGAGGYGISKAGEVSVTNTTTTSGSVASQSGSSESKQGE